MPGIVSPTYSDSSNTPRPCMTCGVDTSPGMPGHYNSTVNYIDRLCEAHDRLGVRGKNCLDCETEALYFCGTHSDVIDLGTGSSRFEA